MLFYFNKYLQKTFKVNPGAEGYGIILMHSQYSDCRGANPQLVTISQVSDTCNIFEGTKEAALNRLAELRILYPHLSYHLIKYTVLED